MAAGTNLVIQYATADGSTTTHTWKYAKSSATLAQVQALITATIAEGEIFTKEPTAVKSAKIVTTTETPYDLSEVMQANGRDLRSLITKEETTEGEPGEEEEDDEGSVTVTTPLKYTKGAPTEIPADPTIARLESKLAKLKAMQK